MQRRTFAVLAVVVLAATTGCLSALEDSSSQPAGSPAADVQLSSVGQTPINDGQAVEVSGSATNHGDATTTVNVTVTLLNDSTTIAERTTSLGTLASDESASFALEFDVNPDRVDGRTITFD